MNTNTSLEQKEEMVEQQEENDFAALSRMRLQMFMNSDDQHDAAAGASSISTSTASRFEMTTADIHKKYSVDIFSRESDTSEDVEDETMNDILGNAP
jgi:hypothetical protein